MIPTGTVYPVGRKHHWPHPAPLFNSRLRVAIAACSGWPIDPEAGVPAVSVDIADRCRAKGCGGRWDRWLRATVHAALVEAMNEPEADPSVADPTATTPRRAA